MALKVCTNCWNRVSDKASSCPHCMYPSKFFVDSKDVKIRVSSVCPDCGKVMFKGVEECYECGTEEYEFEEQREFMVVEKPSNKICPECGTRQTANATACPKCGCPASEFSEEPEGELNVEDFLAYENGQEEDMMRTLYIINCYNIDDNSGFKTRRGIGFGASSKDVIDKYGESSDVVELSTSNINNELVYSMGKDDILCNVGPILDAKKRMSYRYRGHKMFFYFDRTDKLTFVAYYIDKEDSPDIFEDDYYDYYDYDELYD